MEYVDSTDELAYITSLEQQNYELLAAIALIHSNAAESPEWIRHRTGPLLAKYNGDSA